MTREAVLLTGGASRRMGRNKADLVVDGEPIGLRVARELESAGWPVTVLGREPIGDYPFIADVSEFAGPLAALRGFGPRAEVVFVASCDMPGFRGEVASVLAGLLEDVDAVVPMIDGYPQLLCAVYRGSAFAQIQPAGVRMRDWLARLDVHYVKTLPFPEAWVRSANTMEELQRIVPPHS